MVEQKTLEIGEQKIYTETFGAPSQTAVLLISGAGSPGHFWSDSFCQYLVEKGYFVIRYDHRDVGLSHPCKEPYELKDLAADAIGILDSFNIQAAHIVGHSMGGYIAQLLGASHPNRVLSLTIISAGPLGATPALTKAYTEEEKQTLQETWGILSKNKPTQNFEESVDGFMRVWRRLNGKLPFDEARARSLTEDFYTHSRYPIGPHNKHVEVMQRVAADMLEQKDIFSKIKSPTLVIHGAEDYLFLPQRGGGAIAEMIDHAELEIIPDMGHMFFNGDLEKKIIDRMTTFFQGIFIM